MSFYDTAYALENEVEQHFRLLAEQCASNEGMKHILLRLADDHHQHGKLLMSLRKNLDYTLPTSHAQEEAAQLFHTLQETRNTFSCSVNQLKVYEIATALIKRKYDIYVMAQSRATNSILYKGLTDLIAQEKAQLRVLENIVEMVRHPHQWIENAEFYHFDEY